jgi:cytochrome c553
VRARRTTLCATFFARTATHSRSVTGLREDDPQQRAEIGLRVEPNATPAEALVQACGACHNDVLDQTLSRARFSIALARMSRDELELAIERIQRAADDPGVMPPHGMRELDETARGQVADYLRASKRSPEDGSSRPHAWAWQSHALSTRASEHSSRAGRTFSEYGDH